MSYRHGDKVIYPHHGAAKVVRKEKKTVFGEKVDYFKLRLTDGETILFVPVDKVDEIGVRKPISAEEADDLLKGLTKKVIREPGNWSRRFKNNQEKLKSGDIYKVAEIVKSLAIRRRDRGLSSAELTMYKKARSILVSELVFSFDATEKQVETKIDKAIAADTTTHFRKPQTEEPLDELLVE